MRAASRAGLAYFAMVLAAGFVLGVLRVTLLVPAIGEAMATLVELPIILAFSWLACGLAIGRFQVPASLVHRSAMGALAFALLMLAELLLGIAMGVTPPGTGEAHIEGAPVASAFDQIARHVRRFLASFHEPGRLLGLLGQIVFGVFPVVRLAVTSR